MSDILAAAMRPLPVEPPQTGLCKPWCGEAFMRARLASVSRYLHAPKSWRPAGAVTFHVFCSDECRESAVLSEARR